MAAQARDPQRLIAVIHAPPRDTRLDQAPAIDEEFRLQSDSAGVKMMSVGSSAVRRFIEERQPLLGLHGHVHESRGEDTIGRTLCINPGSEYAEGVLCGSLVTIIDDRVTAQFVAG